MNVASKSQKLADAVLQIAGFERFVNEIVGTEATHILGGFLAALNPAHGQDANRATGIITADGRYQLLSTHARDIEIKQQ
jgi:hypothetical protein